MPDPIRRDPVAGSDQTDHDVDRGDIDPDVIRSREGVGVGSEGPLPDEDRSSPIGSVGGHIAAGSTPVATTGAFDTNDDLFPDERRS